MSARQEFKEWLVRCHDILKDRLPHEVVEVALACGFVLEEVTPDVSEWVTASQRRLRLWGSPFFTQWLDVTLLQKNGTTWND